MSLSDCPRCWDTPCTCGYRLRPKGGGMSRMEQDEQIEKQDRLEFELRGKIRALENKVKELCAKQTGG